MANDRKASKLQACPRAVGKVISSANRVVTVRFYDIPENPPHVKGTTLAFQVDIRPVGDYKVGDNVVAGWAFNPPRNPSNNAIRTEGTTTQGRAHLRDQRLAMTESDSTRDWLRKASASLDKKQRKAPNQGQEERKDPDGSGLIQVQSTKDRIKTKPAQNARLGGAWLPTPVPVPEFYREWAFDEKYLRIGYVAFTIDNPVEEIQISEAMPFHQVNTLRSRTPIQKGNMYAQQQIAISMTFADRQAMNEVLLPLVRLFRRVPFLPVFNKLLIEYDITALAFQSLQVQSIPGFPNALKVTLLCWNFNWQAYFPGARELMGLDALFCYPLLKLWVEKPVATIPENRRLTGPWDGKFVMYTPDEDWLETVNESILESTKAIRRNEDIENALIAHRYATIQPRASAGFEGFDNYDSKKGTGGGPTEVGVATAKLLSKNIGRALIHVEFHRVKHYVFYKTSSVDIARLLAESPDVETIIRGPVLIQKDVHRGIQTHREPGEGLGIWYSDWDTISKAEFLDRIKVKQDGVPDGDPSVRRSVEANSYTFVVPFGSGVFEKIGKLKPTPRPAEPSKPVVDRLNAFEPHSLVLESISVNIENIIAPLQIRGERISTHQYMGSMAAYYQIAGTLTNSSELNEIREFLEQVNELGRKYTGKPNGQPFGGFCIVENELFEFFGTRQVLPMAMNVSTVPDFPGALRFEMTLVEFDPTQRRKEVIRDLMDGAANDPTLAVESVQDSEVLRYVRQNKINDRLRAIDLYPDLALPTHLEIVRWLEDIKNDLVWDWQTDTPFGNYSYLGSDKGGTGWQWFAGQNKEEIPQFVGGERQRLIQKIPHEFLLLDPPSNVNRYADPDFYCAPSMRWGEQFVDNIVKPTTDTEFLLMDTYGTRVVSKPQRRLRPEDVAPEDDPGGTIQGSKKAAESVAVKPVGATAGNIDRILHDGTPAGIHAAYTAMAAQQLTGRLPPVGSNGKSLDQIRTGGLPVLQGASEAGRIAHYQPKAAEIADYFGISRPLFFAMLEVESSWDQRSGSPKGAIGLGQLKASTARELDPTLNVHRPIDNMILAARYLRKQLDDFGSEELALAAYNAGPSAVRQYGNKIPPYKETMNHVRKVASVKRKYEAQDTSKVSPDNPTANVTNPPKTAERAFTREAQQLLLQFDQGYGFKLSETRQYILEAMGSRSPYQKAFIKPPWRRDIYRDFTLGNRASQTAAQTRKVAQTIKTGFQGAKRSVTSMLPVIIGGGPQAASLAIGAATAGATVAIGADQISKLGKPEPETYYVITREFIQEFLDELSKRNLHFKLYKIPERVPGQYKYDGGGVQSYYQPPPLDLAYYNPATGRDIFHDLRRSFIPGRLLNAFPTYYVAIVDGGRWLKIWRLYDHVYGMMAITQIAVHRTRHGPIETATVGFSNIYGHLTAQMVEELRERENDTRNVWALGAFWRGFAGVGKYDQETIAAWAQLLDSMVLKPGARLHIRLGYGSDCSQLPVVFNGVITEVPVEEGEVQVVALSDGVELTNDLAPTNLQGSIPVTRLNSFLGEGINPRELVMSFMAPNNALKSLSNLFGDYFGRLLYFDFRNEYGIEHFGSPIRAGLDFDDSEVGINIYNPEASIPFNKSTALDSVLRILQIHRWEKNTGLLGINMAQANPWRIFETVRKCSPDFICYPVPVELRSTLFLGKGWFPLFTHYRSELTEQQLLDPGISREDLFEWKPFQQFHIINSDWNLIHNLVRRDATDVITKCQAVGTYNGWKPGDGDLTNENSFVMNVDTDIYDEHQKMKVVESGLYTTVHMKVAESFSHKGGTVEFIISALATVVGGALGLGPVAVAGVLGLASGPIRQFLQSRRILDYFAAMTLKDHVKEMYQGPFVILGNGWIKPYDILGVNDRISGMNGLSETKSVIHTMSVETGFISQVTPDCISTFIDYEGADILMWLAVTANHIATGLALSKLSGFLSRKASIYFSMRGVNQLNRWINNLVKKAGNSTADELKDLLKGGTYDELLEAQGKVNAHVRKLRDAAINGNNTLIRTVLDEISDDLGNVNILQKTPLHIKAQIQIQRALRSVPGLATAKNAKDAGASILSSAKNLADKTVSATSENLQQAREAFEKAQAELKAAGASPSKIQEVRASIINKTLDQGDKQLANLIEKVDKAKARVSRSAAAVRGTKIALSTERAIKQVIRGGLSKTAIGTAAGGIFTIAVGSISDYLVRWAVARQCLTIYPLRIYTTEFAAGINGHRGAVFGDRLGGLDQWIQRGMDWIGDNWWAGFIPVIGDLAAAGVNYRTGEIPPEIKNTDDVVSQSQGGTSRQEAERH